MFKSNNLQICSVLFSVIPGFVAYLIKDNALNDLCGKTLLSCQSRVRVTSCFVYKFIRDL